MVTKAMVQIGHFAGPWAEDLFMYWWGIGETRQSPLRPQSLGVDLELTLQASSYSGLDQGPVAVLGVAT